MANVMTKNQIQELNNKCSSNWKFDTTFFVFHSMKTLFKKLKLDETGYLEFRLFYNNENQITLNIRKFNYKGLGVCTTEGKSKRIILDNKRIARKNVSKLLDYTERLTDEKLLKISKTIQGGNYSE